MLIREFHSRPHHCMNDLLHYSFLFIFILSICLGVERRLRCFIIIVIIKNKIIQFVACNMVARFEDALRFEDGPHLPAREVHSISQQSSHFPPKQKGPPPKK